MKLTLDERRRRLRDLVQTHPGLVLASALIKGDGTRSTSAERSPAPSVNQSRTSGADAFETARPCTPAQAMRPGTPTPSKRAGCNRAVQLNLW
jgi:hypothetical protein